MNPIIPIIKNIIAARIFVLFNIIIYDKTDIRLRSDFALTHEILSLNIKLLN